MHTEKLRPDRRCARRWNVMWPATVVVEGHTYHCTIKDLSEHGARIEVRGLPHGMTLANLESERFGGLAGRIQWARGIEAGLRFEAAPEVVMQLLKPIVPGMGRREKAIPALAPVPQRRSLGRLIREKFALAA